MPTSINFDAMIADFDTSCTTLYKQAQVFTSAKNVDSLRLTNYYVLSVFKARSNLYFQSLSHSLTKNPFWNSPYLREVLILGSSGKPDKNFFGVK